MAVYEPIPLVKISAPTDIQKWGPLAQGKLARPRHITGNTIRSTGHPDLPEADLSIISRVEELAKKKDWKMSDVAMAWLTYKGVSSPIIGISSVARLDEAVGSRGKELTEEEVKHLEEAYVPKNVMGHG